MVTPATTAALVIIYAPAEILNIPIARVLDVTAQRITQIAGGTETGRLLS